MSIGSVYVPEYLGPDPFSFLYHPLNVVYSLLSSTGKSTPVIVSGSYWLVKNILEFTVIELPASNVPSSSIYPSESPNSTL